MTTEPHVLTVVAFLRGVGGQLRVLLAVDRGDTQLYDGEPAILVEHRPGAAPSELTVECADALPMAATACVLRVADELVGVLEAAFDRSGTFDGDRLIGRSVIVGARPCDFVADPDVGTSAGR